VGAPPTLDAGLWFYGSDSLSAKDDTGRYLEYRQNQWVTHHAFADRAAPLGNHRTLLMRPNLVSEYQTDTGSERTIRSIHQTGLGAFLDVLAASRSGAIWVLGENGVARLLPVSGQWKEFEFTSRGLRHAAEPFEGDDGSLFVVATEQKTGLKVLARFDGVRWKVVYRGKAPLVRGWPGADGALWLQDAEGLHLRAAGKMLPVQPEGPLSGAFRTVVRESAGVFWIGTNQGVARYAAPIWRTPTAVADVASGIEAAWEDSRGTIWFASPKGLLRLRGESWEERRFPPQWSNSEITQLWSGRGGDLLIGSMTPAILLAYREKLGTFRQILPPPGHDLQYVLPRDATSVWVCTKIRSTGIFTLQIYDGGEFREYLRLDPKWQLGVIRAIYRTPEGDLWLGGSGGFGFYSGRRFRSVDRAAGYTDSGCFSLCRLADGSLLAGGREKLSRFNGTSWSVIREGLDRVRSILQTRDGTVWVTSGTGVHGTRTGSGSPTISTTGSPLRWRTPCWRTAGAVCSPGRRWGSASIIRKPISTRPTRCWRRPTTRAKSRRKAGCDSYFLAPTGGKSRRRTACYFRTAWTAARGARSWRGTRPFMNTSPPALIAFKSEPWIATVISTLGRRSSSSRYCGPGIGRPDSSPSPA
jgi:hypothetical protein